MMRRVSRRRKGFTLIELLVVVAIIALLISILLPSLRDAKEQAKVAKCLANLRSLMQATIMYFQDYNDAMPFVIGTTGGTAVCSWSYGGKTSSEWWKTGFAGGSLYFPIQERPMNPYLLGGKVELDLKEGGQMIQRAEVPLLRCPSDRHSHQRDWQGGGESMTISSYDDIGTSYHFNLHALDQTNIDPWAPDGSGQNWVMLCRKMVHDTLGGQVATLIFYMPDPMDFSYNEDIGVALHHEIGNHGKSSKHSAGFLDGHADYSFFDTRAWCGVGWNVINKNWVRRMGQRKPPIYYQQGDKNCEPPDWHGGQ
jgi:prepilin-type N-terminal cleavage/methylation domain-containing protein